jgi:NAD(P)-dependent dehydrogenase (short-subunit alcohol dehydrogenase family)
MLTKMSARQLGPHGIRVNAIAPGAVKTDMINFALNIPDVISQMEEKIPLGRASEPQEIASVALFLASDLASYVNGHVLVADGGLLA